MAMGCQQCLPLSVVQLKGKHCRKPHYHNGVVDTFGHYVSHLSEIATLFRLQPSTAVDHTAPAAALQLAILQSLGCIFKVFHIRWSPPYVDFRT